MSKFTSIRDKGDGVSGSFIFNVEDPKPSSDQHSPRRNETLPQEKRNGIFNESSSHEEKVSKSLDLFLSCLQEKPAKLDRESNSVSGVPSQTSEQGRYQAALRLQKVYRSFRTRRQLADCAVIIEQKWWKVLDLAELRRSSISFFDIGQHGSALSKWSRARTKAAKVGKGLSKDEKARKLALQHWLEAIDPRHRYGHNLQFYYAKWLHCDSTQPFFYWLDIGEGREVDLERCCRARLQQQCIKYLGPDEREDYEVAVVNGKFIYKKSQSVLDTSGEPKGTKWIFVLSACRKLYVGQKVRGTFQHSSFLAGGATLSAGRLVLEDGFLKAVWPHSGHYLPTEENFQAFMSFLMEHKVDLNHVQKAPIEDDEENHQKKDTSHMVLNKHRREASKNWEIKDEKQTDKEEEKDEDSPASAKARSPQLPELRIPTKKNMLETHVAEQKQDTPDLDYKTDDSSSGYETAEDSFLDEMDFIYSKMNVFSNDDREEFKDTIPQEMIQKRINTHRRTRSYQLADQLSFNWTTGAGPRIGCLRDYPSMLQFRAMEHVNLSPRGGVRRLSSPGSAPLGLNTDLFKVTSPLGVVPDLPKLGSLPELHSPTSSGLSEKEAVSD